MGSISDIVRPAAIGVGTNVGLRIETDSIALNLFKQEQSGSRSFKPGDNFSAYPQGERLKFYSGSHSKF